MPFQTMATRFVVCGACLTASWLAAECARGEPAAPATTERAEDRATHDQLRLLRDSLIMAVNAKDGDAVLAQLHPNVVLTAQDGKDLRVIRGHVGVRDYLDRLLLGPGRAIENLKIDPKVDDLSVLYDDDTAVAFGSSLDHYHLTDGGQFDLKTRWSATAVKEGDRWLLANLHVSTNLFDNPVVDAVLRKAIWIAAGAGFIGLLLGLVAGRLVRAKAAM